MARVLIKKGKARPFWYRHPWVFSGAVARVEGEARDGEVVQVFDLAGKFIGQGLYNSRSQIRVRILSHDPTERIDTDFFRGRLEKAVELRTRVLGLRDEETNGYRLVHGEGDGLSGVVVDRYGDYLVIQLAALGMRQRENLFLEYLVERFHPTCIYENLHFPYRQAEGAPPSSGPRLGTPPQGPVPIRENGLTFMVDFLRGQKTGFFFDQRENRALVARYAAGRRVLDCFTYTGAFALYCKRAGAAEVVGVDSSGAAIALAQENARLNGLDVTFQEDDVDRVLQRCRRREERFDLVILDPPKFAKAKKDTAAALTRYQALNVNAMHIVSPGGLLATASCSHHISEEVFESMLNEAAKKARRFVQILHRTTQAPDHPVCSACLEGRYLKFFLVRVH